MNGAQPNPEVIQRVTGLCDQSLFIDAERLLQGISSPEAWEDPAAMCVGARLASHLGALSRARTLALSAYRRAPRSPEARFWLSEAYLSARGPYATWCWIAKNLDAEPQDAHALLLGIRARIAMSLRDFETTARLVAEAKSILPEEPWLRVMDSELLEQRDLYQEALSAARAIHDPARPERVIVHQLAHLLDLGDQKEEAVAVLSAAAECLQSATVHVELARVLRRLERWDPAWRHLERAVALMPWLEDEGRRELCMFREEIAYQRGDLARAATEARLSEAPTLLPLADRYEDSTLSSKRVVLPTSFVRQHHVTCVPASLTMLARSFGKVVQHIEVADRICYDGTSAYAERQWAEDEGWHCREFTLGWDVTRQLIDLRIPFIVHTVAAVAGHAQLVVGYDELRETLVIRDPFQPDLSDAFSERFLKNFSAYGPRAMLMLPKERSIDVANVSLPDADLYDVLYRLNAALERHDRADAISELCALEDDGPGHRLTLLGKRALAAYDANPHRLAETMEIFLQLFPEEPLAELALEGMYRQGGQPDLGNRHLESICARDEAHPAFRERLGAALLADGREHARAGRLLRRAVREMPGRGQAMAGLSEWMWNERKFEASLELARFASTAEPTDEDFAQKHFVRAHALRRTDEGLTLLQARVGALGPNSASPWITLFCALEALDRVKEAFQVLEDALTARGDDAQLLAFVAYCHARYGGVERALGHLESARGAVHEAEFFRVAATVYECAGRTKEALTASERVVELLPLSVDAHATHASRLHTQRSPREAREYVAGVSQRFPENTALLALRAQSLLDEDPEELAPVLERLLQLDRNNGWAWRELAMTQARLGRADAARSTLATAIDVDPAHPNTHTVEGRVLELLRDPSAARAAYRGAIRDHADSVVAIGRLIALTESVGDVGSRLSFIEKRTRAASNSGDGVAAWFAVASNHLKPEVLAERIETMREARPELWTSWSISIKFAVERGRGKAAFELAREGVERFPLIPGAYLDLATAARSVGETEKELDALRRAQSINPSFPPVAVELAATHRRANDVGKARRALERALVFQPLDLSLLMARAELAWQEGQVEPALAHVERALVAEPAAEQAWDHLAEWAVDPKARERVLALARELNSRRPWDALLAVRLAELLIGPDIYDALRVVEGACAADPQCVQAHDLHAVLLAQLGRREAALKACQPREFQGRLPTELNARHAWVRHVFGDTGGAIAEMRHVLERSPRHSWGWSQLTDWYLEAGDLPSARASVSSLSNAAPAEAQVQFRAGCLLRELGDADAAEVALRRSLALEPMFALAALELLSLFAITRRREEAKEVFARYRGYFDTLALVQGRCLVSIAKYSLERARKTGVEAFTHPAATHSQRVQLGLAFLHVAPWDGVTAAREAAMQANTAELGHLWTTLHFDAGHHPSVSEFRSLLRQAPEAGVAALAWSISTRAEHKDFAVLGVIAVLLPHVRRHAELFATVGDALAKLGLSPLIPPWFAGYQGRTDLRPRMLLSLVEALRSLGWTSSASRVGEFVTKLPPDGTTPIHCAWLAMDSALVGDASQAEALLQDIEASEVGAADAPLYSVTRALIQYRRGGAEQRAIQNVVAACDEVSSDWILAFSRHAGTLRRISRFAARRGGGPKTIVRGYSLLVFPLLFAAGVVALVLAEWVGLTDSWTKPGR